jgi:hypothetical protein
MSSINIQGIDLENEIFDAHFSCDLKSCKGACCTFPGENGAPLLNDEIELMEKSFPSVIEYLSERNLNYIEKHNFFDGVPGSYTTVCINKRDCVFVFYENDIARCAFEKAYFDKKIDFRKPISCHLFPIRETNYQGRYLYYQQIDECKPGIKLGESSKISLIDSLQEALIRSFGEDWFNELKNIINNDKKKLIKFIQT